MALPAKYLTLAQVMISQFVSSSPSLGSVLTAQSLEPALDSVPPSLSAPPLLTVSLPKLNTKKFLNSGEEPRRRNSMEVFCVSHIHEIQPANTKPSYTPRKLIGGLTQQSEQPEPQNSAGTWCRQVNLGREKLAVGREPPLQAERRQRLG